jgi:hypothetical protein
MGNIGDLNTEAVEYGNNVCEQHMTIAFSSVHV